VKQTGFLYSKPLLIWKVPRCSNIRHSLWFPHTIPIRVAQITQAYQYCWRDRDETGCTIFH